MKDFLIFGLIGSVELMLVFGFIHYLMSRHNLKKQLWLIPLCAGICAFGYSFVIFIGEGEGSQNFSGNLIDGLPLYFFIFTIFSSFFATIFVCIKLISDFKNKL